MRNKDELRFDAACAALTALIANPQWDDDNERFKHELAEPTEAAELAFEYAAAMLAHHEATKVVCDHKYMKAGQCQNCSYRIEVKK